MNKSLIAAIEHHQLMMAGERGTITLCKAKLRKTKSERIKNICRSEIGKAQRNCKELRAVIAKLQS